MELTFSYLHTVPETVSARYRFAEVRNAAAIIASSCPDQWNEVLQYLGHFQLRTDHLMKPGGNKSLIVDTLERYFYENGWKETRIDTENVIYRVQHDTEGKMSANIRLSEKTISDRVSSRYFDSNVFQQGYKVDALKGRLAIDIEWNAKDGNLDRDLSAYRAWYELSVIDAAILITKEQESCQRLVNDIWARYTGENPEMKGKKPPVDLKTSTTTNLEKAVERIKRGDAGGCPVLIVAITDKTWDQTPYSVLTE